MQAWQERVVTEKRELDERITKLNAFIGDCNRFNKLPGDERIRLTKQEEIMRQYSAILGERILAFENPKGT